MLQLIFDSFNVGRFDGTGGQDGCPDGHMQILEIGKPFTGGSWCGAAAGHAVYYSETATVTVTLRVYHSAAPFEFQLRYKMLGAEEAVVRFGSAVAPIDRGELVPGTHGLFRLLRVSPKYTRIFSSLNKVLGETDTQCISTVEYTVHYIVNYTVFLLKKVLILFYRLCAIP